MNKESVSIISGVLLGVAGILVLLLLNPPIVKAWSDPTVEVPILGVCRWNKHATNNPRRRVFCVC